MQVLEEVIQNCGGQPVISKKMSRFDKLRENTKLLFTVVIDDAAMKKLVDSFSIDEVIMHVLQLGKSMWIRNTQTHARAGVYICINQIVIIKNIPTFVSTCMCFPNDWQQMLLFVIHI